jgi:hypothetical protein
MAAVITIAITLIAGGALFSYVNGQAATSENSLGQANAANVNFLDERFVVADMGFSGNTAVLSIYNNGNLTLRLGEIVLYNVNRTQLYAVFNSTTSGPSPSSYCGNVLQPSIGSAGGFTFGASGTSLPVGSVATITLTLPNNSGANCLDPNSTSTTYYATILGLYGSKAVYYQCDPVSPQQQECSQ